MDNVKQEVLAQEENLTNATRNLDVAALEGIYAEDIVMTTVLGELCGRKMVLDEVRRGLAQRAAQPMETSYYKEDLKIVPLGDIAVANYRFVAGFKGQGIDLLRRYRTTNVWAKRQGRWQIVAAHTAFVLEPRQVAALEKER